jgi:hypothetical protein
MTVLQRRVLPGDGVVADVLTGETGGLGAGDLRLDLALSPLRQRDGAPVSFAVVPYALFPTGAGARMMSNGAFGFGLDLALARRWDHLRVSMTAGYRFLGATDAIAGVIPDDQVDFGVAAAVPVAGGRVELGVEWLAGFVLPLQRDTVADWNRAAHTPSELVASVRWLPRRLPVWLDVGAGPGLSPGFGTPTVRAFVRLGFRRVPVEAAVSP